MRRRLYEKLVDWKNRKNRRPLVLRGARQVGKTYLVRDFSNEFKNYIEINFENDSSLSSLFASKKPDKICEFLSIKFGKEITDGETLIFLDELQAAEAFVLESLRYFCEQRTGLHIIAAGSLLEFMFDRSSANVESKHFPMPVGRIEYMYLSPLDFEEFLLFGEKRELVEWLNKYELGDDFPIVIHEELVEYFYRYLVVGGMPAVVNSYFNLGMKEVEREQQMILSTYSDDFPKYSTNVKSEYLQLLLKTIPMHIGQKLIYSKLDKTVKSNDLSRAYSVLEKARILYKVKHSPANGIPIGFDSLDAKFKPLFFDVGLVCRSMGLKLTDFIESQKPVLENIGALGEQFVGQHILFNGEEYEEPMAYCWMRESAGASAEVDYVYQVANKIIPIEVKSGKTGSMKALHIFLDEKKKDFAVRINGDMPSFIGKVNHFSVKGDACSYSLLSLPFYMICQMKRLIRHAISNKIVDFKLR